MVESYAYNTIRIKGNCQGKELVILIDSESTDCFIDEYVVRGIKVVIDKSHYVSSYSG
jgi:hypothetical protein